MQCKGLKDINGHEAKNMALAVTFLFEELWIALTGFIIVTCHVSIQLISM